MPTTDRSYRALLRVPTLGRVLLSMQIARVAQSMVGVALVLFTLDRYGSPAFAGFVTFASVFPGLLISPIAGALLDRHGRIRLVLLDYLVALAAMLLVGALALAEALPGPLLLGIAVVSSLTSILSHVGLRSLFPILVPEPLWERVNAVDSNGYVAATIVGPPIAAALVALLGGPTALLVIGVAFGIAAAILVGVPEPVAPTASTGRVFADAWAGLRYTWRNSTLRGLGFAITLGNLAHGMTSIVIPLIVIGRFGLSEAVVGLVFAVSGISGVTSAFAFGRMSTRGKEWSLLVWPMVALVPTVALLLLGRRPGIGPARPGDPARRDAARRLPDRADGHRAVHRSPAPDRSGVDGPRLRGLDGVQLPRHAGRCRAGRPARGPLGRDGHPGPGRRRLDPRRDRGSGARAAARARNNGVAVALAPRVRGRGWTSVASDSSHR